MIRICILGLDRSAEGIAEGGWRTYVEDFVYTRGPDGVALGSNGG